MLIFVKSEEGGDTRPLMEFFRGQVASMWANAEKEVSSKNVPQASEVKDEDALRQLIGSVNGGHHIRASEKER